MNHPPLVAAAFITGGVIGPLCAWQYHSQKLESDSQCWKLTIPFRAVQDSSPILLSNVEEEDSTAHSHGYLHARFKFDRVSCKEMLHRSQWFVDFYTMRRSVRLFANDTENIPLQVIENCILGAGTSPSGAHTQPWYFCVVKSMDVKQAIRDAVEKEEEVNYKRRINKKWVQECNPLVSALPAQFQKPYLTDALFVIVMMKKSYDIAEGDPTQRKEVYYPEQSCGIAAGLLLAAIHNANLVTLTCTPMGAESKIRTILNRPVNEKVFLLLPVGFPSNDATVPYRTEQDLRKPLNDIYQFY